MSDQPDDKKAAAAAKARANLAKARAAKIAKRQHVEVASTDGMPTDAEIRLLAENRELRAKLDAANAQRSDAEQSALATAQAQGMLLQRTVEEVPTGKTVPLPRLKEMKIVGYKDDSGRPILKPVFERVPVPTFFYKVDLPPCGGTDLKINGVPFYHGAVYELDLDTLRTVKEIVYKCWKHDADIHGTDENFYRKPHKPQLSQRGMSA